MVGAASPKASGVLVVVVEEKGEEQEVAGVQGRAERRCGWKSER